MSVHFLWYKWWKKENNKMVMARGDSLFLRQTHMKHQNEIQNEKGAQNWRIRPKFMIRSIEKHQSYCHIKGGTWGNTIYDDIGFSWIWAFHIFKWSTDGPQPAYPSTLGTFLHVEDQRPLGMSIASDCGSQICWHLAFSHWSLPHL